MFTIRQAAVIGAGTMGAQIAAQLANVGIPSLLLDIVPGELLPEEQQRGLALMGALSIGVIERTKEIGVLRAIGARSRTILGIFMMEGILQGMISWLIAIPLSLFASPVAARALGGIMFDANLDYQYNWSAVFVWLGIVVVISILASLLPARGATRLSVRDSLAYA